MKLTIAIVLLGTNAIATPAANVIDRNEELVARMKERNPEVRTKTLDVLREMNVDYRALATRKLKEDGEIFDRARIEVDGVNANNNTAKFDPSLFDEPPIQPSYSAQDRGPSIINKLKRIFGHTPPTDVVLDITDYRSASNGEMTERTRAVFVDWKNREINEVVAHSWGCEAVYAAIVNGYMLPPKKLILTGVPDNSFVKWQLLARYTGTRVFWARAENDKVAAELGTRIGNNKSWAEWNLDWESYCIPERPSAICNAHGRAASKATKVSVGNLPSAGGHNRDEYYVALKKGGIIVGTPLDLRRAESAKKAAEIIAVEKIAVEAAHNEALKLVAQAREQRRIAERDHDERLKNKMADMARRSCADPGSVTQAELDGLPEPYGKNFLDALPGGLGECSLMVYMSLGRGANAEDIRRKSTLSTPEAAPQVPPPHQAIRSFPQPTPVRSAPPPPLSTALPRFKEFATAACRAPEQVALEYFLLQPYDRSDARRDDYVAKELSAGMSGCSLRLFNALITTIRAGENGRIDRAWIRNIVTVSSAPSGSLPGDRSRGGAVPPTPDHDPVWGKIGPIIGR